MVKLNILNSIPEGFLDIMPEDLHTILPGPTLIELHGTEDPPIFISTLLHGNEVSGFLALQSLLRRHQQQGKTLPRSVVLFVGNIEAAKCNIRMIEGQHDYNRVWAGGDSPEHKLAWEVLNYMDRRGVFASIDIHNNTGKNPHYACLNKIEAKDIQLARMFSQKIVYFTRPHEVLSMAFASRCPSVTVEAGFSGSEEGVEHIATFVDQCLYLRDIPDIYDDKGIDIYHTIARIRVENDHCIGFGSSKEGMDFCFIEEFDSMNFSEIPAGTILGRRINPKAKIIIEDIDGVDVADDYISYENDDISVKVPVVPSMFTKDIKNIHQDCLGYFMIRYQPDYVV